jgi:hypothetical protein
LFTQAGINYSLAVVGDILCSDLSFVSAANYSASGKTAIGIVVSNASKVLKIVSIVRSDYSKSFGWLNNISTLTDYKTINQALSDIDGYSNTNKIIAQEGSSGAIAYCKSF